jgi:hypothetical protein
MSGFCSTNVHNLDYPWARLNCPLPVLSHPTPPSRRPSLRLWRPPSTPSPPRLDPLVWAPPVQQQICRNGCISAPNPHPPRILAVSSLHCCLTKARKPCRSRVRARVFGRGMLPHHRRPSWQMLDNPSSAAPVGQAPSCWRWALVAGRSEVAARWWGLATSRSKAKTTWCWSFASKNGMMLVVRGRSHAAHLLACDFVASGARSPLTW